MSNYQLGPRSVAEAAEWKPGLRLLQAATDSLWGRSNSLTHFPPHPALPVPFPSVKWNQGGLGASRNPGGMPPKAGEISFVATLCIDQAVLDEHLEIPPGAAHTYESRCGQGHQRWLSGLDP